MEPTELEYTLLFDIEETKYFEDFVVKIPYPKNGWNGKVRMSDFIGDNKKINKMKSKHDLCNLKAWR